jgi:hypothetical protein
MTNPPQPEKPIYLPVKWENIPPYLKQFPHFVAWRAEWREGDACWAKVPYDAATGRRASVIDPTTWATYDAAAEACQAGGYDGPGFVLTVATGLVAVDLDHAVDEGGVPQPWALAIVRDLDSYTERSPTGRGLHVWTRAELPPSGRRQGSIEMYCEGRYLTLTGHVLDGYPSEVCDRPQAVHQLHECVFRGRHKEHRKATGAAGQSADWEVITHLKRMANGAKFSALFEGDTSLHDSHSEADAALLQFLLWRTGGNVEQSHRLFGLSGLARDKWFERPDYRERTTNFVLEMLAGKYYDSNHGAPRMKTEGGDRGAGETPPVSEGAEVGDDTCYAIILRFFRTYYQPTFKRGTTVFSAALGREVKAGEARAAAPIALIRQLADARDAPRLRNASVDWRMLPSAFYTWSGSAWVDLLAGVPLEEQSVEVHELAYEEFTRKLLAALACMVTFGQDVKSDKPGVRSEAQAPQRRSVLDWCRMWAKPGPWRRIRSLALWTRIDEQQQVRVALTTVFFSQVGANDLAALSQRQFNALAITYGLAEDVEDNRAGGFRATFLTAEVTRPLPDESPPGTG